MKSILFIICLTVSGNCFSQLVTVGPSFHIGATTTKPYRIAYAEDEVRVSIDTNQNIVIWGDTMSAIKMLLNHLGNRKPQNKCECGIQSIYYKNGKIIERSKIFNTFILKGTGIKKYPFTNSKGNDMYCDSVVYTMENRNACGHQIKCAHTWVTTARDTREGQEIVCVKCQEKKRQVIDYKCEGDATRIPFGTPTFRASPGTWKKAR